MQRYYYSNSLSGFAKDSANEIVGRLTNSSGFAIDLTQRDAWLEQIAILKESLDGQSGRIFFEYSIPRMGRRADVVLIIRNIVFVVEFKAGADTFSRDALDQVWDYALDFKNFHETSHDAIIAPILVATRARATQLPVVYARDVDNLISPPLKTNRDNLGRQITTILESFTDTKLVDVDTWDIGRYSPTPTIIEAATALYRQHSVENISRSDAAAKNLRETGRAISKIIEEAKQGNKKSICFVTGVPGAGKTLVGLDVATKQMGDNAESPSVFLSGNGPLVDILREALARDSVHRAKEAGTKLTKGESRRRVKLFIQNVHHYRDEYLKDDRAPVDHVAVFDEAQRAWNQHMTSDFMRRKRGQSEFNQSEPEFLISCLDRHQDWAVIVCLVGGGQEINRGEAGIGEWIESLNRSFPKWNIYISDRLTDTEYAAGETLSKIEHQDHVVRDERLHLSVSMRSYRAERVSDFVKAVLDLDTDRASKIYGSIKTRYPIVLTRDINAAKEWLRTRARGSERYGLVCSSNAYRLKPHCIDIRAQLDHVKWFLEGKEDVRSSYFLEDAATEFQVQGLELDWACVTWDADFRYSPDCWQTYSFVGSKWNNVNQMERKQYLKKMPIVFS